METNKVIEYLQEELDSSYAYTQRGMFVEINTSMLSANGFPITVFVTNNSPDFMVVSDSAWIYEGKYGNWTVLPTNERKNLEVKWGITVRAEETGQYYHTIICRQLIEVKQAVEVLSGFIKELSHNLDNNTA